jgi:hypothetical protein
VPGEPAPRGCFAASGSPTLRRVRGASVPTRATKERNKEMSVISVAGQQLIRCSRLAVLPAIAAACLGFSGVAQAAAPPDPNTVGATALSHIELNGVPGTERTVAPGQDVKIKANWEDDNTACPHCVDFVPTAFAGKPAAGCIEPGAAHEPIFAEIGPTGSGEVDLGSAPTKGGTYNVVAQFEEVFQCGQTWNAAASPGYQVIARVTVLPVPADKAQCKKGGWRELADSNGAPFKNQGQCVSFVATEASTMARRHRQRH